MEAMVATSRSIIPDKFLQRESKRKYEQHVKKVGNISGQKIHPILEKAKQSDRMTQTMYRSKTSAKQFKKNEIKVELKKENKILLEKIWKINSNIKFQQTSHTTLQHVSGSNWNYKKKQADVIREQNKRIASSLMGKRADIKQYKKKMQQQIKEYMDLKNQIRKCKYTPKKDMKRSKSEKKTFNLKLKDELSQKDQVQNKKDQNIKDNQEGGIQQEVPDKKGMKEEILGNDHQLTEQVRQFERQLDKKQEKKAQTSR